MVRRIRFMYWKVIELFRNGLEGSGILWKVLEGSRREVRGGPGLGVTRPWPTGAHLGAPQASPSRPPLESYSK